MKMERTKELTLDEVKSLLREGSFCYDGRRGETDFRFLNGGWYGGINCGMTLEVFIAGEWKPTRLEMDSGEYYLVGVKTEDITSLRARMYNHNIHWNLEYYSTQEEDEEFEGFYDEYLEFNEYPKTKRELSL